MELQIGDMLVADYAEAWRLCRVQGTTGPFITLDFGEDGSTRVPLPKPEFAKLQYRVVLDGKIRLPDVISCFAAAYWKYYELELDCKETAVLTDFDIQGTPTESLAGAPNLAKRIFANDCGLTELNCKHTIVEVLNVASNPSLHSLENGPSKAETINAAFCAIRNPKTNTKGLKRLDISYNPIETLKDCPKVEELVLNGMSGKYEALWLAGRCKRIANKIGDDVYVIPSIFRFKHALITVFDTPLTATL